jgi:2-keto-4-pentenoate hydratase/2-oxohepta-3-ene-1,7-dioic acid hydratase in catechol pathway
MSPVTTRWGLVTIGSLDGGPNGQVGVQVVGAEDVRVPDAFRGLNDVLDVVRRWDEMAGILRSLDPTDGELARPQQLRKLLSYPAKILCSGPNFRDHLAEMGESGLGESWTGYFFFKPPTTALIGPEDPIEVRRSWQGDRVDWEGELAVIVGRGGRDLSPADVPAHIAGYTVANDVSWRGPHRRDTSAAPFVWDWIASKAPDTSLPMGPGLVPSWQVSDTGDLNIRTSVNGAVKQNGTTADMILNVNRLVADASALMTLEPGDVILTGTPAGVGAGRNEFLAPGDVVEVEIGGIGTIRNEVRLRDEAPLSSREERSQP